MYTDSTCGVPLSPQKVISGILTVFAFTLGFVIFGILVVTSTPGPSSAKKRPSHHHSSEVHLQVDEKDYAVDTATAFWALLSLVCVCFLLGLLSLMMLRKLSQPKRVHLS